MLSVDARMMRTDLGLRVTNLSVTSALALRCGKGYVVRWWNMETVIMHPTATVNSLLERPRN